MERISQFWVITYSAYDVVLEQNSDMSISQYVLQIVLYLYDVLMAGAPFTNID